MKFSRNILFGVFIILVMKFCSAKLVVKLIDKFELFKNEFSKNYQNSTEEHQRKLQFEKTNEKIEKHNQEYDEGKQKYKMSHNQFSDRFENEINKILSEINYKNHTFHEHNEHQLLPPIKDTLVPNSFNWLEKGWNTPVLDQGDCGSCYAFTTAGTIEAAYFVKYGEYIKLSEQDIIDCSIVSGNTGCDGGFLRPSFNYVMLFGLSLEQYVPYIGNQNTYCSKSGPQLYLKNINALPQRNEEALKYFVATYGPIAVTFNVVDSFFQYSQGIYNDPNCDPNIENHDLIIVGYDSTEDGDDYWLVKNSWGTAWGDQGYAKIKRNVNQCGIANNPLVPTIESSRMNNSLAWRKFSTNQL